MAYIDLRLPMSVELGSRGGPQFKTTITALMNRAEARNQDWQRARVRRDVGFPIRTRADMEEVIAHFMVMRGNFHSFPFRDWSDYEVTDEAIATVSASVAPLQLIRTYGAGTASPYVRQITKPEPGAVTIKLGGVLQVGGVNYTLDDLTGVLTPLAPWTGAVTWSGMFLVPVRYAVGDETLGIVTDFDDGIRVDGLEVIEVAE